MAQANALVLPGVGAFGDCVRSLERSGMREGVVEWARSGRPFFGICVGYQMLFDASEEAHDCPGLGIFAGTVRHFPEGSGLKIPQIGWNTLHLTQRDTPLLAGVAEAEYAYFVHSYYVVPRDPSLVALETTYGLTFASAIVRGNLVATQFHPEKSQRAGLKLLQNFVALANQRTSVLT